VAWALLAQALSSTTNVVLGVVVARVSNAEEFGVFSLALAAYLLLLGVGQAATGSTLIVTSARQSRAEIDAQLPACLGGALLIGSLGAVTVGVWAVVDSRSTGLLLALAASLPGAIVQATWRYTGFIYGRPRDAALADGVWLAVQVSALTLLSVAQSVSATSAVLAWGIGATSSTLFFSLTRRLFPRFSDIVRFWVHNRRVASSLVLEYLLMSGTTQIIPSIFALQYGLVAAGGLRGALILLGGIGVALQGIGPLVMSKSLRASGMDGQRVMRVLRLATVGGVCATGFYVGLVAMLPDAAGESILGSTWVNARRLLFPVGALVACQWVMSTALMGLRTQMRMGFTLSLRLAVSTLTFGALALCGQLVGDDAALLAISLVALGGGIVGWHRFLQRSADAHTAMIEARGVTYGVE
jgi:O-antigen/teichoic acid export membrane protein